MQRLAEDARSVIASLGYTDYVLVGHSMGGKIAQALAARRPAGLAGLVLVAPAPAAPVGSIERLQHEIADTIAELGDGIEGFTIGDRVAVSWFGDTYIPLPRTAA